MTKSHSKNLDSKTFQGRKDFIEDNRQPSEGINVPKHIKKLVLNVRVAHATFEKGIAEYMHAEMYDHSEVQTVERIIEENPYYLTAKNGDGDLPIHSATSDSSSFPTLIPLLAKAGIQHGVGGESGRGGLLVENSDGGNPLVWMALHGHLDGMKALLNAEPPLLIKSDVAEYALLHEATQGNNLDMMKMMIEIDPAALYQMEQHGRLPIHYVNSLDAFSLLLKSAIDYDPKHTSVGGLFVRDEDGDMPINQFIEQEGKEDTITCIEQALSAYNDIPILHKAILHTPKYVHDIITAFPDSCFLRDENGRLPIHVALETGMKWSLELTAIMNGNLEHLGEVDPVTQLCLGALAAIKPTCGLRTINYLMLKHPKNVRFAASSSDNEQCKRRKMND